MATIPLKQVNLKLVCYTRIMASKEPEELKINSEPNKIIPKLATKVAVARSSSGNVILSFVSQLPGEDAHMVERLAIDEATARELASLIKESSRSKTDE